jgi:3-dehydroquinate synthase
MIKSRLYFKTELPPPSALGTENLVIYDRILAKKSKAFKKWIQHFPFNYGVRSGEALKDVKSFPEHISRIIEIAKDLPSRKFSVVVVGGGSLGDFGGFVASVLKRGVPLIQIPSTWLAAIDSSHGGKTALNVGQTKNQIGTFYPAEKIILVESLLSQQPEARLFEGFGELVKIALIDGGSFWQRLSMESQLSAKLFWKYLKPAINAKYKIVQKDPHEKLGSRHVLNFGHTFGHVLEVQGQLPHGVAVNYGLHFALKWSQHKKILRTKELDIILSAPLMKNLLSPGRDGLLASNVRYLKDVRALLLKDKKKTKSQSLRFVFLKKPGHCVIHEVLVDDILIELVRQMEDGRNG